MPHPGSQNPRRNNSLTLLRPCAYCLVMAEDVLSIALTPVEGAVAQLPSAPPPTPAEAEKKKHQERKTFRTFDGSLETLATDWRNAVISGDAWQVVQTCGSVGGEAQSLVVRCASTGGYAKPGHNNMAVTALPRAAHEKIVSDLAYELHLPIPPVILWDRGGAVPAGQERYTAISALAFTNAQMWGSVVKLADVHARILPGTREVASAMTVLDTWVDNRDRVNEGNLLVTEDTSGNPPLLRMAYIDYAYSLTYGWMQGEGYKAQTVVGCYPSPPLGVDVAIVADILARIEALPTSTVEKIVKRIPDEFLPADRRQLIIDGLVYRAEHLRIFLRTTYTGLS